MAIIEDISHYCESYSTPLDDVLTELMHETQTNVPGAQMLTGHLVGTFLTQISELIRPKYIIELGTYTGFSAICLAKGLDEDGEILTIDIDDRWNDLRKKYWKKSGLDHKINLQIGPALDILKKTDKIPELAFIDADKANYWNYADILISKMAAGSWIIADNVLFKNEVLKGNESEMSNSARHISEFNQKIINDSRVDVLMLPVRDGITILKIK